MTIKLILLNGEELLFSILPHVKINDLPQVMLEIAQNQAFSTYAVLMLSTWYVFNPETDRYYKEA